MLRNVHRIEGNVTYISLTRGQEAMISTVDLERVLQVRWYAEYIKKEDNYRPRGRLEGRPVFLSRYLLNPQKDEWVDHINFDTLDNRRENLRIVTPSENRLHQRRDPGQSGMLYIHVVHPSRGYSSYLVTMMREGVRKSKNFPHTPEGLQAAQNLVAMWLEDFSYNPPRTMQRRLHRSNLHTSDSENGPHLVQYQENSRTSRQASIDYDDCVYITLSRGQRAVIDKSDAENVAKHRWVAQPASMGGFYAATHIEGKTTYLHRFLLDAPMGMYVDHINHDTLDNRRSNLNLCTNQENNANRDGAYITSKTGIRGVSTHKCAGKGLMYVFRCHCVTCKVAKYFPYTEEGLETAKAFAEAHYAAMKQKE